MRPWTIWMALLCATAVAAAGADTETSRHLAFQKLSVPDPLPALAVQSYDHFSPAPGITAERVSYATEDGSRIPALVYHSGPATIAQHPAIVLIDGSGGDKSSWYAYWAGILYARAGALVLSYDAAGEYERDSDRESSRVFSNVPANLTARLAGLRLADALQSVRYLASRKDVDPKRIAVIGYKAVEAGLACSIDVEIDFCMLAGTGHAEGPLAELNNLVGQRCPTVVLPGEQPGFLSKTAALWLEEKVKMPDWTRKQVQRMQETTQHGAAVLGDNIPAVSRADLHAVPDVVWQTQQDNYTFSAWVQRVSESLH